MNQIERYNTPIYNYLKEYASSNTNIFHMPGHKLGMGIPKDMSNNILQLDVTEIDGTDNLHYPEGIIKDAQQLASEAFGADKTFFLVNGSTCGIQAAIMSVCQRGDKIIIGRDSHKSVISGLILSGAEPVFVFPEYNEDFGISEAISAKSIENKLREEPDIKAVLITRPNYYGICSDISEISRIVHLYNKILIVDEAHGAHLAYGRTLPPTAVGNGADICIQSAHKTLPAVTQGAYLHINGNKTDLDRLKYNLSMLQTSSPSYIIMSYLDIARELMVKYGPKRLDDLVNNINLLKIRLQNLNGYMVLSDRELKVGGVHDTTRLVINLSRLGINGYYAEKVLRDSFRTQAEMADYQNLVFITTVADTNETIKRLGNALTDLSSVNFSQIREDRRFKAAFKNISQLAGFTSEVRTKGILPFEVYSSKKEEIALKKSSGRICADTITPYPPGIPVLYPGEIIDERKIEYILYIIKSGGNVNGIGDNNTVHVIK